MDGLKMPDSHVQPITQYRVCLCYKQNTLLTQCKSSPPKNISQADFEDLLKNETAGNHVYYHRVDPPNWARMVYLLHRLLEAYVLPIHMMILIISSGIYCYLTKSKSYTLKIGWEFTTSSYLRIVGFGMIIIYVILYEDFHNLAVMKRRAEMRAAGLYEGMQHAFSYRESWKCKLDYIMIPIAAAIFGSLPAIQAQLCHFWTLDLEYTLSKKTFE
jgi:hypothetical protein